MTPAKSSNPAASQHTASVRTVSFGMLWRTLRYPFVILAAILIPRMMGDSTYGKFAFFMAIFFLIDALGDVGITQICGRYLATINNPLQATRFLHSLLVYGIVVTLIVTTVSWCVLTAAPPRLFDPAWWPILVILLFTTKIEGTLFAYLYGRNEIGYFSIKELVRSVALLGFALILYPRYGITGAITGILLGELITLAFGIVLLRKTLFVRPQGWTLMEFMPLWLLGLGFYVPALVFSYIQRSGNVLIEFITGNPSQVAYYDIANQIMLFTSAFIGLIFSTILPTLARLYHSGDFETIKSWNRTIMSYCTMAAVVGHFVLVMLGKPVVETFLGPSFAPVFGNAVILFICIPFILLAYAGANTFLLLKKPMGYTGSVMTGLVVMIVTSCILTPFQGSRGMAWATVAGYAAMVSAMAFILRAHFTPLLSGLCRALAPGVVCIPLFFFRAGVARNSILCGIGIALYCGTLLLLRIVKISELKSFATTLRA